MVEGNLQSGDTVVPLAGLARTAAILGGSLSAAIGVWVMRHRILDALGALAVGGIVGFVIGSGVGAFLYPAVEGNVRVIKAAQAALPETLKAAVVGAISSSICVAAALSVLATPDQRLVVLGTGFLVGTAVGLVWGVGAALA